MSVWRSGSSRTAIARVSVQSAELESEVTLSLLKLAMRVNRGLRIVNQITLEVIIVSK